MRTRYKTLIAIAAIAAVAVILRVSLPVMLKSYVNSRFADMGPYTGRVTDVDVALVRGAYTLHDLQIVQRGADRDTPFLDLPVMDISLDWSALFAGELVGEIVATGPQLNLIRAESSEASQLGSGVNWPDQIRELFPFKFNRIEVVGGTATFLAPGIAASEALRVDDIRLELENLTNIHESEEQTAADMRLTGRFLEQGAMALAGTIDPNAEVPTFDLDFSLEGAPVTAANPWLQEFLNVDAESGDFSMYLEAAAADGRFEGYLKPVMENLEIFRLESETEGPFRKAWEALVGFASKVFQNRREDQVATRIPFSGEFEDPDIGTVAAIASLIRNAFVSALSQSVEGTVDIEDVAGSDE
jgi:hypothetical protein